jgi:hypothetical protein
MSALPLSSFFIALLLLQSCNETKVSAVDQSKTEIYTNEDTIIGSKIITNELAGGAYRSRANSYFIVVGSDTSVFQPVFMESKEGGIVGLDFHTSFVRKGLTHQQRMLELIRIIPRAAIDYDLTKLGGVYLIGLSSPPDLAISITQEYRAKVDETFKDLNDYQAFSEFLLDSQLGNELNEIFRPYGVEIEKFNLEKLRLIPKEQFLQWHKVESDTTEIPDKIIDCFVGASFKLK